MVCQIVTVLVLGLYIIYIFDRKIYHLTLREGYCARFDDRSQSVLLWPSQKKTQWHRSRFSNTL